MWLGLEIAPAVTQWWNTQSICGSWKVTIPKTEEVHTVGGYARVHKRSNEMQLRTGWYLETGFIGEEVTSWHPELRQTWYTRDGRVADQFSVSADGTAEERHQPPWWWGVTDQAEPTAPWVITWGSFEPWALSQ